MEEALLQILQSCITGGITADAWWGRWVLTAGAVFLVGTAVLLLLAFFLVASVKVSGIVFILLVIGLNLYWMDQQRRSADRVLHRTAFDPSSLEGLPMWAVYPDADRPAFANKLLQTVWKSVRTEWEPKLMNELNDLLKAKLPSLVGLGSARVTTFDLGEAAPQILAIRSFSSFADYTIDLQVLFMCNHPPFSVTAFSEAEAALVSASIENAHVQATVRISLTPIISSMPYFGRVEVSLLNAPRIDFDLKAASIFLTSVPVLKDLIYAALYAGAEQIRYPKSIRIPLVLPSDPRLAEAEDRLKRSVVVRATESGSRRAMFEQEFSDRERQGLRRVRDAKPQHRPSSLPARVEERGERPHLSLLSKSRRDSRTAPQLSPLTCHTTLQRQSRHAPSSAPSTKKAQRPIPDSVDTALHDSAFSPTQLMLGDICLSGINSGSWLIHAHEPTWIQVSLHRCSGLEGFSVGGSLSEIQQTSTPLARLLFRGVKLALSARKGQHQTVEAANLQSDVGGVTETASPKTAPPQKNDENDVERTECVLIPSEAEASLHLPGIIRLNVPTGTGIGTENLILSVELWKAERKPIASQWGPLDADPSVLVARCSAPLSVLELYSPDVVQSVVLHRVDGGPVSEQGQHLAPDPILMSFTLKRTTESDSRLGANETQPFEASA
jgi:hypothetical protein